MENNVARLCSRATLSPKTLNEDDRSVSINWGNGQRGIRSGWGFRYYEELSFKKKHIRLERAKRGLPFQDSHEYSTDDNLGRVHDVKIEKGEDGVGFGSGRVVFDTHEKAQRRFESVRNGSLTDVSVGYRVYRYEKVDTVTEADGEQIPVYRAVDWEPMEISLVVAGFDTTATVRSTGDDESFTPVFDDGEHAPQTRVADPDPIVKPVPAEEPNQGRSSQVSDQVTPANEPTVDVAAERELAAANERKRVTSIMDVCKRAGFECDASDFIARGASIEDVRAAMFDKLAERQVKPAPVQVTRDERETQIEGMRGALLHRINKKRYEICDNSRRFAHISLVDVARQCCRDFEGGAMQVVARALQTSSEFTNLLSNVAEKTLMDEFELAPRSFEPWVRRGLVNDFKTAQRIRLGDMEGLIKMNEHSEFKNTTLTDRGEPIKVDTYGRKFGLTREAIVNDDLNAFTRLPNMIAMKAATLESDLVYSALIAGTTAAMSDGNPLFDAAHGNIGTGGPISVATLNEMVELFRKQTTESGDLINVMPRYLIVPAELEGTARAFLQTITPSQASEVNVHVGQYQIIVDPRLSVLAGGSPTRWYMAADPAQVASIELVNLRGAESIQLDRLEKEEILGVWWRAYYDVGVAPIEWRGIATNVGVGG